MNYLLYGQDLQKLNYHLDKIKLEHAEAELVIVDSSVNPDLITSIFSTPPMFSDKKLIILEDISIVEKIDFSLIHPNIDVVIVQKSNYPSRLPQPSNATVIEAKKIPLIFKFLDDLTEGSQKVNLERLFRILSEEEPALIFYQLISHIRRLILAKSGFGFANEKLADWQIQKYQRIGQRHSFEKFKTAYRIILGTEFEQKFGEKGLKESLPFLVLRLTQNFQNP